jgi:colicin import membrane protein
MAAAMHAGLFFFLWVGVHWQSNEPVAVEAEVWDMKVQTAAPPPPPAPEPAPAPEPVPTPKAVTPPPAAEPAEDLLAAKQEAEIALERKKAKLKAEKERLAEIERKQELEREREEAEKAAEKLERLKKEKAEKTKALAQQKAEQERLAKEEAAKEEAEKKKADEKLAEKKEAEKKAAAEKAAKAKRAAEEQKAADKARAEEMRRLTGDVGGTGSTGTAAKSTGPKSDSGYNAAIRAKIKSNISYTGADDPGNPTAVYKIQQLPTGEIISVRKIKGSGNAAYDSAVENAIAKSSPLPKKKDGTVEREIEAVFKMKD